MSANGELQLIKLVAGVGSSLAIGRSADCCMRALATINKLAHCGQDCGQDISCGRVEAHSH